MDNIQRVGYEALTQMVMKNSILWDISPCTPVIFNRCFEETFLFHVQG